MTPDQYHEVLLGLDKVLEVFKKAAPLTVQEDHQLKYQIATIRAQVLRAESGIPFPLNLTSEPSAPPQSEDPALTMPPWNQFPRNS